MGGGGGGGGGGGVGERVEGPEINFFKNYL